MRSDFSRGSAISGSVVIKPGPKKLDNLLPAPESLRNSMSRQISGNPENNKVPKSDDLQPLDNPAKSVNLALLDL